MVVETPRLRWALLPVCLCACLGFHRDGGGSTGIPVDAGATPLCIPLGPLSPSCFPRPRPGPRCELTRSGGTCETLLELPCGPQAYPGFADAGLPCDVICRGFLLANGRPTTCAVVTPAMGAAGPIVACRQPCE